MHPAFLHWWKQTRGAGCCGPAEASAGGAADPAASQAGFFRFRDACGSYSAGGDEGWEGSFGVRRPLRFLAYKLGLDEAQVAELARILNDLKTERAQAAVDSRRTLTAFADALTGEAFDQGKATEGAGLRLESAKRLKEAVVAALAKIHAILKPEQRERLAYLIRTGTLSI